MDAVLNIFGPTLLIVCCGVPFGIAAFAPFAFASPDHRKRFAIWAFVLPTPLPLTALVLMQSLYPAGGASSFVVRYLLLTGFATVLSIVAVLLGRADHHSIGPIAVTILSCLVAYPLQLTVPALPD